MKEWIKAVQVSIRGPHQSSGGSNYVPWGSRGGCELKNQCIGESEKSKTPLPPLVSPVAFTKRRSALRSCLNPEIGLPAYTDKRPFTFLSKQQVYHTPRPNLTTYTPSSSNGPHPPAVVRNLLFLRPPGPHPPLSIRAHIGSISCGLPTF